MATSKTTKSSCCKATIYWVQRVYEYHKFCILKDRTIELISLDDAVCDGKYDPHFECSYCNKIITDLDLNPNPAIF